MRIARSRLSLINKPPDQKAQSMYKYRSKFEIERKLQQIEYIFNELKRFQNRVFVRNGLDQVTGCYPLEIKLGSFLIYCRSTFQYALKEINESGDLGGKRKYDDYIEQNRILSYFKNLRDSEIHSLAITLQTTITGSSPIRLFNKETGIAVGEKVELNPESLENFNSQKDINSEAKVEYRIAKRLQVTPELIKRFESEGKLEFVEAAKNGVALFETQEFNGTSDLFILCRTYLESIKSFVQHGIKEGLIT